MQEKFTISCTENITAISFKKVPAEPKVISRIFNGLAACTIPVDMISQTTPTGGAVSFSFTLSDNDMSKLVEVSAQLQSDYAEMKPFISVGNCKLNVYSESMKLHYGVAARALEAFANANITILLTTTSDVDMSFLVSQSDKDIALQALEDCFL